MASVISNYSVLHELWDWLLDNRTVTEMKARIRGVQVYMYASFRVHIWLGVGSQSAPANCQLKSVCLQRTLLSVAEDLSLAAITIRTLNSMRADDKFALFCKYVTTLHGRT